ncbi:MAG: polysaccharide deacetylase family protein [Colwellia sp.]
MLFKLKGFFYKLLSLTGGLDYFWHKLPNGLYNFNYHRIGNKEVAKFDRAIFSCTAKSFDKHVQAIKDNFIIINPQNLEKLIKLDKLKQARYAIISFDDGYADNYYEAFPILKKYNVTASFFITTNFIESNQIPWWDEIAFLLRESCGETYRCISTDKVFELKSGNIDDTIKLIMQEGKKLKKLSILDVLYNIREQFPKAYKKVQEKKQTLFMTWAQIEEIAESGMEIGSHTLTHRILSQLSAQEQKQEIFKSKAIIENKLNGSIFSIAYPVGRYHCYNETSLKLAALAGYKVGFNNEAGNHLTIKNCYDINRYCIARDDINRLKYECCF